ncbi:hypothetical protein [Paenibacillus lemnae]|uniref:Lipoprotein n=1 Tax=Paenibacillus lemnae TaxID=1330551 RepID=A0A848M032_PAELE|nr:hypothetical protein [Paenibacillus lemnae]NMO94248.1 hypothetical protein [Paenibacillus lemnae]
MKKFWYISVLAGVLVLSACSETEPSEQSQPQNPQAEQPQAEEPQMEEPQQEEEPQVEEEPQAEQPVEEPQEAVDEGMPPTAKEAATTVLRALKSGDMETVAAWAHPERGVRFSPYAYIDPKKDQVLTREEMSDVMSSNTARKWGEFAGSGKEIELTYADYHEKFVYDANFFDDAEVGLNKSLGEGTTVNNLNEVYPKETHDFVEYHIEGVNPEYGGVDWRSLRLVFEKNGMDRSLVGIVHDEWTP